MNKALLLLLLPISALASDLKCPSSHSIFDTYLCNAYELSELDKSINAYYQAARNEKHIIGNNTRLIALNKEQQLWIQSRDNCLTSDASHECIINSYQTRIDQLKQKLSNDLQPFEPTTNPNTYTTQQLEYSVWSQREENPSWKWPWEGEKKIKRHYFRKKAILLNTSTGESWGLEYTATSATKDGYSWVKIDTVP